MPWLKRHAGYDRRAVVWLRVDAEFTRHQLPTLPHARKTETTSPRYGFRTEPASSVTHGQGEHLRCALEAHRNTGGGAVPHRILQRLLQHSEQAQRDIGP